MSDASVEVRAGGLLWRVRPEHRDLLFGERGLRLEEWLKAGLAHVVKHGSHRTVYDVQLPGLHFFLKHNRLVDFRTCVRGLLRPGKALAEYRRALAIAERQVPTVVPLAVGEPRKAFGESYLLTQALEHTEPLNLFLEHTLATLAPSAQVRIRQRIAVALGSLLADMHVVGVNHRDLHAGNVLLRLVDDQPELFLIDLHAVQVGRPLEWRETCDNLVILNRWFALRSSRTDRLRFWQAYCQRRRQRQGKTTPRRVSCQCRARIQEIEAGTRASNIEFWRKVEGRCLRSNRRYRRIHSGSTCGFAVTDLDRAALQALLADPDAPFRQPGVEFLKNSRSSTVIPWEMEINGVRQKVLYKRIKVTSWQDPWLALVRPPPALRSWLHGHALRLRWIPTPRPLAVFHRVRHGLLREGYLLTTWVEQGRDLHDHLRHLATLPADTARVQLRALIGKLALLVRTMHERGLAHRDLKASNLLITPPDLQQASSEPLDHWPLVDSPIWLIDLVGVTRHRVVPQRRRLQNLARLNASFWQSPTLQLADRLRFLRLYLGCGLHRVDWKKVWRDVQALTDQKIARNARKNRPLA